ncbi:MAG: SUF system NifU family Fe-S cluster assembly protein [Proteobacteria bacterium]|nr:SUF system NifU family Fe-S cluster assembly protein [Pseudomonadota bacterium]
MTSLAQTSDELQDLYRELIIDHARSPRHFGKLPDATHTAEGINPLCGDKLKMYFRIDGDDRISDARFEGSGCAISVASASLLTDTVIGLNIDEALKYFSALVTRLAGVQSADNDNAGDGINLGKLRALEGVREFPSRVKCATLAWHALNSAIQRKSQPATTE